MFNYKKIPLLMIFTTFFLYSTNKTESPCANSRYSQCLNCFSYLLPAVVSLAAISVGGLIAFLFCVSPIYFFSLPYLFLCALCALAG